VDHSVEQAEQIHSAASHSVGQGGVREAAGAVEARGDDLACDVAAPEGLDLGRRRGLLLLELADRLPPDRSRTPPLGARAHRLVDLQPLTDVRAVLPRLLHHVLPHAPGPLVLREGGDRLRGGLGRLRLPAGVHVVEVVDAGAQVPGPGPDNPLRLRLPLRLCHADIRVRLVLLLVDHEVVPRGHACLLGNSRLTIR
jgi:hypothetical protein